MTTAPKSSKGDAELLPRVDAEYPVYGFENALVLQSKFTTGLISTIRRLKDDHEMLSFELDRATNKMRRMSAKYSEFVQLHDNDAKGASHPVAFSGDQTTVSTASPSIV